MVSFGCRVLFDCSACVVLRSLCGVRCCCVNACLSFSVRCLQLVFSCVVFDVVCCCCCLRVVVNVGVVCCLWFVGCCSMLLVVC